MSSPTEPFDIDGFLIALGARKKIVHFRKNQNIFSQGERSDVMFYIEKGDVKLTVTSKEGREAIVGVVGGGEFFGESCIVSDRAVRFHTATALTDTRAIRIDGSAIRNSLSTAGDAVYSFISSLIRRNALIQEDLASHLLESSEKRLAGALLAIGRLKEAQTPPFRKIDQQDLASMIRITRQRVKILLSRFRKPGHY
jgi:CRP-like cAMP-binding protein